MSPSPRDARLNYGRTFVIGLGFFTTAISWSLYNSYVPIFLRRFVSSTTLIGFIMTLDNWAAIVIQPWIGALSDRTRTRIGRRMPFIAGGIPVAALFFVLLPIVALRSPGTTTMLSVPVVGAVSVSSGIWPLFGIIMLFNIAMASYRAPVVALMPDVTPSQHRSKANGVINLMGGIGSVLAFFVGSFLYEAGVPLPFVCAAAVMVLALVVLLIRVREPLLAPPAQGDRQEAGPGIIASVRQVIADRDLSAVFILLAIFFWFFAYNGIETWFTTYGVEVLKITESAASRMITAVALTFVVFALPAGFVGARIGRKPTILVGIGIFVVDLVAMIACRSTAVLYVLLAVAGVAWALINVNSITIVWELARATRIGTYTGLYYFFSALAQIVSPPVMGLIMDRAGTKALFPAALVSLVAAGVMMAGVRKGEVQTSPVDID